jgi:hypothetical protein
MTPPQLARTGTVRQPGSMEVELENFPLSKGAVFLGHSWLRSRRRARSNLSRTQRASRRADWRSWTQAVTGVRSRSGRGGGWGAREAHEEEELTGFELAGVFARSNSQTWPAVLGSVLRRLKATSDVKRRRNPKPDVCRERPVRRALGVCAPAAVLAAAADDPPTLRTPARLARPDRVRRRRWCRGPRSPPLGGRTRARYRLRDWHGCPAIATARPPPGLGRGSSAAPGAATPAASRERPCLERRRRAGVAGRTTLIEACHAVLRSDLGGRRDGHRSRPYSRRAHRRRPAVLVPESVVLCV